MPIIDRKTVTFHTTVIEGVDTIKYVDALYQNAWQPFKQSWDVYQVDAYINGTNVSFDLGDKHFEQVWVLAEQHQAKQHEND